MSDLIPPLDEELNQLANPTFPVMHDPKASTKGPSVFSAKGTLEYDKLDISEFAFAFLEFIAQQPQSQCSGLMQYLRLRMEKAMNYTWSSVKNFNMSINNALVQGRLNWGQMDIIQAKSNTFFSHGISVPVRIQHPRFSGFAPSVILPD